MWSGVASEVANAQEMLRSMRQVLQRGPDLVSEPAHTVDLRGQRAHLAAVEPPRLCDGVGHAEVAQALEAVEVERVGGDDLDLEAVGRAPLRLERGAEGLDRGGEL